MPEPDPKRTVYPYIPNSVPEVKAAMLKATGAKRVDAFYADIPDKLRLKRPLNLPQPLLSECALTRHVEGILDQNTSCDEYLSFLGAGCYQHYVPAVCDEVNSRSEFLTAYAGEPYDDLGRFQALFEYASMMGELLEMDVVNVPTYDGYQAAATALRMAARMTGRREALLCGPISVDKLSKLRDYCEPGMSLQLIGADPAAGQVDLTALEAAISTQTAAVYFENPSYLGVIETEGHALGQVAHTHGAECVVYCRPDHAGRAGSARRVRRGHRVRRHPAAGHAHAVRRRAGGLHRHA